jgi:putative copper resistance protein D
VNDPLIYARAIHFAATLSVTGAAFFLVFIAEPASRGVDKGARLPMTVRVQVGWTAWIGLLVTLISGAAWLVIVAHSMSGASLAEVFSQDVLGTVLLQTGFGQDWIARSVLAVVLAGLFVPFLSSRGGKAISINAIVVALAAGLTGSLVWAGHAVGAAGIEGIVHPAADFLHLVAAAAWVGTLLPLALLLSRAGHDAASVAIARMATVRFSSFGIGSVATLLVTGSINAWYLAGSIPALTETDYGHLLMTKVALFLGMVAIAAVNRLRLTPRLVQDASAPVAADGLWQLRRNTAVEVAVGAVIIAIVAALGTDPPGFEAVMHTHHPH